MNIEFCEAEKNETCSVFSTEFILHKCFLKTMKLEIKTHKYPFAVTFYIQGGKKSKYKHMR